MSEYPFEITLGQAVYLRKCLRRVLNAGEEKWEQKLNLGLQTKFNQFLDTHREELLEDGGPND